MAASAGTVTLNLDANSVKLLRELQKSERASRKTAGAMRKEFGAAFKAVAIATAAAGAAFGRLAKQSIDAQDRMAKMAQTTGVSTEALSQLEFAAKLSGSSLDGLRTGLLRLSRTASDAANGLSTAQRAFTAVGVSAKNQDGTLKKTDELLLEIAERFAGFEDGAAKAALAQELFGRAGASLIPLLNQGKDGIQALREEADQLGLTMGGEAAKAAERFNDNLTRVNSAFHGLINQATQAMLPMLEALSASFVDGVKTTDGMSRAVAQLVTAFRILLSVATTAYRSLQIAGTAIGGFFAWLAASEFGTKNVDLGVWDDIRDEGQAAADDLFNIWSATATQIEEPATRIREALSFGAGDEDHPLASLRQQVAEFGLDDVEKELAKISRIEGFSPDMMDEARLMVEWLRDAAAGAETFKKAQSDAAALFDATRTPLEKFNAEIQRLNDLRDEFVDGAPLIDPETYQRGVEAAQDALDATNQALIDMKAFADQAARNMQDAFAQFLFDPFEDGLKGMLRGFIDTMRRMAAEAAAAQIMNFIVGAIAGAVGGGGIEPGASQSGSGTRGGSIFGGGRATGGSTTSGKAYLVGERGPELVVPGRGYVVPNHALGGSSVTFQIDARGADAQLTRALPAILEGFGQRIKSDIAESSARRRGLR